MKIICFVYQWNNIIRNVNFMYVNKTYLIHHNKLFTFCNLIKYKVKHLVNDDILNISFLYRNTF